MEEDTDHRIYGKKKKEKKEGNFIKFAHQKLLPVLCRK